MFLNFAYAAELLHSFFLIDIQMLIQLLKLHSGEELEQNLGSQPESTSSRTVTNLIFIVTIFVILLP
jgi:hypothetical protein